MFTGIVEEQGTVVTLARGQGGAQLTIGGGAHMTDLRVGQSIAVDGVCLTVAHRNAMSFTTDLSAETLERTTLGNLRPQSRVNLERPLKVGDPFGGHFVTGHVDGVGQIVRLESAGDSTEMWINFPAPLANHMTPKGSIAVDGVSLTLCGVSKDAFSVCLIPHTQAITTLGWKGPGSFVNLEVDVLSRYLERLLAGQTTRGRNPFGGEFLHEQGFA